MVVRPAQRIVPCLFQIEHGIRHDEAGDPFPPSGNEDQRYSAADEVLPRDHASRPQAIDQCPVSARPGPVVPKIVKKIDDIDGARPDRPGFPGYTDSVFRPRTNAVLHANSRIWSGMRAIMQRAPVVHPLESVVDKLTRVFGKRSIRAPQKQEQCVPAITGAGSERQAAQLDELRVLVDQKQQWTVFGSRCAHSGTRAMYRYRSLRRLTERRSMRQSVR